MHTGYALIAALTVMVVSLSGALFASGRLGTWLHRHLNYLTTFSAGVFLLIAYHLASEAVEEGGWLVGVGSVLLGALLMEGLRYIVPNKHHHHGHALDHAHTSIDGRRVLLSDALHNIGDGILIVGAFTSGIYIGIAATIGVIVHEMVQEISEYFVLREAGYTHRDALLRSFIVSSTILIGFFAAAYLSSMPMILAILSGMAAGGFLSVVLDDLLPHAVASVKSGGSAQVHTLVALLGGALMLAVQMLMPHEEQLDVPEISTPTTTAAFVAPPVTTPTNSNSNNPTNNSPKNTAPTTQNPAPPTQPVRATTTNAAATPTAGTAPASTEVPQSEPAPSTGTSGTSGAPASADGATPGEPAI